MSKIENNVFQDHPEWQVYLDGFRAAVSSVESNEAISAIAESLLGQIGMVHLNAAQPEVSAEPLMAPESYLFVVMMDLFRSCHPQFFSENIVPRLEIACQGARESGRDAAAQFIMDHLINPSRD